VGRAQFLVWTPEVIGVSGVVRGTMIQQAATKNILTAREKGRRMLNNKFAREALKQAATQVNQGVREGARQFVEKEVDPLRSRLDEMETRVARLERQIADLLRDRDRTGR